MNADRSTRAYRILVGLYPRKFRDEYGTDMVQLLADQLNDESKPRVWCRAALDVAITVPARHLEARHVDPAAAVSATRIGRFTGALVFAQGLALAALGFGLIVGDLDQDPNLPWDVRTGVGFLVAALACWTALAVRRRHPLASLILICPAGVWAMAMAWWTPLVFTSPLLIVMAFGTTPWESIVNDELASHEPPRLIQQHSAR